VGASGWTAYWRQVFRRAVRDTWRLFHSKLATGVTMALITPCLIAWFAWDLGLAYPLPVFLAAVICTALTMVLLFFFISVGAAPYRLAREETARRVAVESECETLRALSQTAERRARIKVGLGELFAQGEAVPVGDKQAAEAWGHLTHDFVLNAFGSTEATLFLSSAGMTFYGDGTETSTVRNWMMGRLQRLGSLIERADQLSLQPASQA